MRWFSRRSDADYQAEIHEHLEAETQANIDRGMPPDEARRAARAAFGSVASVRQRLHEGRSDYWLSAIGQDVRFGLRMILKHRLLSCIVVLTMSVGIGCTTAVFSLLNAIVFAPPVSHDPDSFVQFVSASRSTPYSLADVARYETLRNQSRSLRELAAWSVWASAPFGDADALPASAVLASCNLFQVISGAPAVAGRLLQASDCDARLPVAVISELAWRRRFGGDPGIVGRSVAYGKHVVTVVGVASVVEPNPAAAALWLPYTLQPQMADLFESNRGSTCFPEESAGCRAVAIQDSYWLSLAGRLAHGSSRAAAAAELKVLMSREASINPDVTMGLKLTDGSPWSTGPPDAAWVLALVLMLPTVIALIVCANVASLLLSRAVKRQPEMAIRLAIGGSRLKLVRMLLVEQMLLAGVAAVLSLWLVRVLPPIIVAQIPKMSDFLVSGTGPDWRVLAYLAAVAMVTAIGAGTAPALESLNVQFGQSLKGRAVLSGHRGVSRTQGLLICAQVALSMVPLVSAAALVRVEGRMASPGFDASHVAVASVFREAGTTSALQWPLERVEPLAAVRSVALAATFPPFVDRMIAVGRPGVASQEFPSSAVSLSYFRTLGISLVSGRPFRDDDHSRGDSERAAIVSAAFARRVFPGQDAVGKTFDAPGEHKRFEIVGVAADTLTGTERTMVASDRSFVYELIDRDRSVDRSLLVRFTGDADTFLPMLKSALQPAVNRFVSVETLQSILDERLDLLRILRRLVLAPAAVGLALALIGVFGILAFTAAQRRKEVAIRAAVGASRADLFGGMLRPALRPTALGIALGAAVSFAGLRLFETVSPNWAALSGDLVAYLTGACLLLCAALAAMSSPAWRAATADPSRALRED